MTEQASSIERIHVVYNPGATCIVSPKRFRNVKAQLQELQESKYGSRMPNSFDDSIAMDIDPKKTAQKLDDAVNLGDIVLLIGGDGSGFNLTNASLRHAESPLVQHVRSLRTGGGFSDDGPCVLNTRQALRRPSTILDTDNVVSFHPIEWKLNLESGTEVVNGNLYGAIGGSGAGANAINQSPDKDAGKTRKTLLVYKALRQSPRFGIQFGEQDPELIYETGLGNSTRMAEFNCYPYDLTDPRIWHYKFTAKQVLRSVARFQLGKVPGHDLDGTLQATIHDPTFLQIDGEDWPLIAGDSIEAMPAAETVQVFSTLLENIAA